ncbi:type VII secretion target [Nocardia sp. NBC_00565]|uniref:type VII secretion target n=1 Tax=Nocardia sp. NBC_00565 TaxID=2975993 RepID=UPI002E80BEE4|nr:type VII secretion target [Nocardia sp. NBC_00565]WUC07676.1 type VII secretion target [Nocardia sp. NBC_00565]
MPGRLDMDPESLRRLAAAQEEAAARVRRWAKRPDDWLKSFIHNYGPIALPVKQAMDGYYDDRERAGNAMADQHLRAARNLREAAAEYERSDDEGARDISQVRIGPGPDHPSAPGPSDPGPAVPHPAEPGPAQPGPAEPGPAESRPTEPLPPQPPSAEPGPMGQPSTGGPFVPPAPFVPIVPSGPGVSVPPISGPAGTVAPPSAAGTGPARSVSPGPAVSAPAAPPPAGPSGPPAGPGARVSAPTSSGDGAATAPSAATPSPGTLPAAVSAARERAARSARVADAPVNDDLVVARTFLAAVLAATESTVVGVSWAVAVLRGSYGAGLFITTNEGRGWLPAGLFLPREVSTPWLWDKTLDDGTGSPSAVWEGIADPARVLVEFGRVWGAKAGAELTALASSGPIDARLRAQLGIGIAEGMIGPAADVDLRIPAVGTVDRLGLTRPNDAFEHNAPEHLVAAPDAPLRERCLELAADTHARLARTGSVPAEAVEMSRLRDRIIAGLQAGQEVPRQWWDELRAADELLAASLLTRRVPVAHMGLGDLRADDRADALRALAFQRRCTELVLLLDGETSWQQLRDQVYAYEQVVKHPVFADVAAVVAAPESGRYQRPVDIHRVTAESNERVVSSDNNRWG